MRFNLMLDLGKNAFKEDVNRELTRILSDLAQHVDKSLPMTTRWTMVIRDKDGERLGVADVFAS